MSTRYKIWLAATGAALAALIVAAIALRQSFALTAFSDIIQCLLLASGTAAFVPLAARSEGRLRLFWSLIALGIGFWFTYQLLWTYYEVVKRVEVPALFDGDIILFLHIVPLTAALTLRPHVSRDEYAPRLGRLDFALLLVWWFYLYVVTVIPWQYVVADAPAYSRNLNTLYLVEKLAFLTILAIGWIGSKGDWRNLYASLFGMGLCYSTSSYVANWALARNLYYSGSLYDVPLAIAMAWLTWIGLRAKAKAADSDAREVSTVYGVWVARCGMIAVFSLPLFAIWTMSSGSMPARIRLFRLVLTLIAALVMGVMVLLRQHLLDRELVHLLNRSQDSFDSLKRLQAQIVQSEKLASIGQLVGGAAHELNNPITALLGYSDLLSSTPLTAEQQPLAAKIGQHVRRTKSLVASLISFARPPAPRTSVDLNALMRTAIKLTQNQWQALKMEVRAELDPTLPKIHGDSNQLLQVCIQLVGNGLHFLSEQGGIGLNVSTRHDRGTCMMEIATIPLAAATSSDGAVSAAEPEDSLGLSACQGILQEHQGQLCCERRTPAISAMRVELPADPTPANGMQSMLPALWQSRPFA